METSFVHKRQKLDTSVKGQSRQECPSLQTNEVVRCPICGNLVPASVVDHHVNQHLDEDQELENLNVALQLQESSPPKALRSVEDDARIASLLQEIETEQAQTPLAYDEDEMLPCPVEGCTAVISRQMWNSHLVEHDSMLALAISNQEKHTTTQLSVQTSAHPPIAQRITAQDILTRQYQDTEAVHKGVIGLIRDCFNAKADPGCTVRLSGEIDFFESQRGEDLGWACGYRNIQMIASHLLLTSSEASSRLFGGAGFVPSIYSIQEWLEAAWAEGFDPQGCRELGGQVMGTQKWIGTTECCSTLRHFGVRCSIVDFTKESSSSDHVQLVNWVWNYFAPPAASRQSVTHLRSEVAHMSSKAPLYFQHEGHSRTIIGVERRRKKGKEEVFLLVLDPSCRASELFGSLRRRSHWERFIKRGIHTFRKNEYQVLCVDEGFMRKGSAEYEQSKVMSAIKIS
eukprot:GILK01014501.1.p1 GENE.GILK01014501.1~~GILK01014501.1.p1  ORF type:complete len:463 (+),score=43.06 GILK01014501.1:24-1391(+)